MFNIPGNNILSSVVKTEDQTKEEKVLVSTMSNFPKVEDNRVDEICGQALAMRVAEVVVDAEAIEVKDDGIDRVPVVQLNRKQRELFDLLLQESPPNLEIWGRDVETLIKLLGGSLKYVGFSTIRVYWGGSKMGVYEVVSRTASDSMVGYLTSRNTMRVAEILKKAISMEFFVIKSDI